MPSLSHDQVRPLFPLSARIRSVVAATMMLPCCVVVLLGALRCCAALPRIHPRSPLASLVLTSVWPAFSMHQWVTEVPEVSSYWHDPTGACTFPTAFLHSCSLPELKRLYRHLLMSASPLWFDLFWLTPAIVFNAMQGPTSRSLASRTCSLSMETTASHGASALLYD